MRPRQLLGPVAMALLAQAAALRSDGAGTANEGHLTEGTASALSKVDDDDRVRLAESKPTCVKWAELKLPCTGSEWWSTAVTRAYKHSHIKPQLISTSDVYDDAFDEDVAFQKMHDALDANHRKLSVDSYAEESGGQCVYGWATNPLCVPARTWKKVGADLRKMDAKTVLWKRTNLAKWASSVMFKANHSSGCYEHNLDLDSTEADIEACLNAHLYFPPALFLNVITIVSCMSSLQDKIMAVASPHVKPVRAYYESLELDPDGEKQRVLTALGVPNMEPADDYETLTLEKISESLRDRVDNFNEMAKYLKEWDAKLTDTGCRLHDMFVSSKVKLWSDCKYEKLCPALHGMQELDWEEDEPPPAPWDYIKTLDKRKGWAGKHRDIWYKHGSFKDYYEW